MRAGITRYDDHMVGIADWNVNTHVKRKTVTLLTVGEQFWVFRCGTCD